MHLIEKQTNINSSKQIGASRTVVKHEEPAEKIPIINVRRNEQSAEHEVFTNFC